MAHNKLMIFVNSFDYGSTGNICSMLIDGLKLTDEFDTVFISSSYKSGKADFYISKSFSKISLKMCELIGKKKKNFGLLSKRITKKTLKKINEMYDFSQYSQISFSLHNINCSILNLEEIYKFGREKKATIFITLHDCWYFTGACPHFTISGCDEWKRGCTSKKNHDICKCRTANKLLLAKKRCYANVKTIFVSPSKWIDSKLTQSIAFNGQKHYVLNNGILLVPSNVERNNENKKGKITVLAVSSPWNERKGLFYLNELADILDGRYEIVVVGITNQNVNKKIKSIGFLPPDELKDVYDQSDIFVNPTLEDTFPTVNIEALSHGLPIVAFDVCGASEAFDDATGIVCKETSSKALKEAVESIHLSAALRKRCIERSKKFDKETFVRRYANIVNENI